MKRMFLIALVIFVADQLSKLWVLQVIDLDSRGDTDVFPPYLVLRMAWNEGINFGLIDGASKWVLIAIAILITGWVIWWMSKEKRVLAHISGGLLIGGALGNVIDRVLYGAVADFLNMSCCGFENPYSFNIADIAIFIGAFGLILFTGEKKSGDAAT